MCRIRLPPSPDLGDAATSEVLPDVTDDQLTQLVADADAARDRKDSSAAAQSYAAALALAPDRVDLAVQHANMLKDSGRLAEAEAGYRQVLTARPDVSDTYLQLGHVLKLQGRRAAALAAYQDALRLNPASSDAIAELANAGQPTQLQRIFQAELRAGGGEALIAMSHALAAIQRQLEAMVDRLPNLLAAAAFPVECYAEYRATFAVPAPPPTANAPRIAVILLADREPLSTLHTQLAAFEAQTWPYRTLIVTGSDPARRIIIERAMMRAENLRWEAVAPGKTYAAAERQAVLGATGDWIVLLAPSTILDPQALAWIAVVAEWSAAPAFIWDSERGEPRPGHIVRSHPELRQVVDYDTLLEANVYGESLALRSAIYSDWIARHPTVLSFPEQVGLLLDLCRSDRVGHIPFPLSWSSVAASVPDIAAHRRAVAAHLAETKSDGCISDSESRCRSVSITWRAAEEAVHVIIPTRDNAGDVAALVETLRGLAERPQDLTIAVIDNGGRDTAMRQILERLADLDGISLQTADTPFNWSQLNNEAAQTASSQILVFANDDMRMLTSGWDSRLRGLLQRPDVGAVGARLVYDDDTVQHAGVLLGWKGSVIHDGLYEPADAPGPGGRFQLTHAVSAVTGAFLATRQSHFQRVGGFEAGLAVSYNDIDFCLKLRTLGLKVLWTPDISLMHYESKTRGMDHTDPARAARNSAERALFEQRWAGWLDSDPGVNPAWYDAILPFRLLSAPSAARVRRHIERCGAANPWLVSLSA